MKVLGIETSCDDTGVAIVENGRKILAEGTLRQTELHRVFGGVVPEVASREHLHSLFYLLRRILRPAGLKLNQLDLIAVTRGPGLKGSLLVGTLVAQTLAYLAGKPLVGVNHLKAHLFASLLNTNLKWRFPLLALLVSGGHTDLVLVKSYNHYQVLGTTQDDAAGEAFDKIGKLLGLPYPAGPEIDSRAQQLEPVRPFLPRPMLAAGFNFSFSGLKTAVRREPKRKREALIYDAQEAIVDVLVAKVRRAYHQFQPRQVLIGGGVAANSRLRQRLRKALAGKAPLLMPEQKYSLDNAAMVAAAAYFLRRKRTTQWYNLVVEPDLTF